MQFFLNSGFCESAADVLSHAHIYVRTYAQNQEP